MNCLKQLQRFFSGIIAIIFFVTNTLVPVSIAHAANVESPAFISSFTIPAEFGKVTDRIKGSEAGPLLIHIQEAHANYDAQKNIKNILEYLSKNYGIRLVLLEGAGNKLDATLFKFFPREPELQQTVNEKLMQAGELTGAELFLISSPQGAAEGWGVEKAEAYAQDREAFKRVFEGRELAQDFSETFYRQWQKCASLLLSKPLKEFLTRETAFEEGRLPLADWMVSLKMAAARDLRLDLDNVLEQKDWPVLVRYFRLKTIDPRIDTAQVEKEKTVFLKDLTQRATGDVQQNTKDKDVERRALNVVREVEQVFEQAKKNDRPSYKTRFVFEKLLDQLPKDFSFDAYPNLRLYLQQIILLSEIQGDTLQNEIKNLTEKLTARLIKTKQDRRFAGILHDFRLVKKLFELELSRSEYQTILSDKITLEKLLQELQALDPEAKVLNKSPSPKLLRLKSLYGTAIRFYEGAIERENWMMKQALARMQERKQTKAVLITGGFHTEGLKEKVLSAGSSYVEITPRIGEVTADSRKNYLTALLGKKTVETSQIAALVRSDMYFLKEVFPKDWRRKLAELVTNLRGKLRQVVSPERAQEAVSDFLAAARGVPALQPAGARSEMREPGQDVVSPKPDLPGLTLGIPLDIGSERRGTGIVEFGALKKAARLLEPLKESFGMGRVYPYNSLFATGDISSGVHQVPNKGEHFLISKNRKTTVMVRGYETKGHELGGLTLRDGANNFSILSMLKLNPRLSDSNAAEGTAEKTERDVRAFNKKAHGLGIKTMANFIPWLAPDAIDETNLDWTFYEKRTAEENEYFRSLSENAKQNYINNLLREKNGAFFARRMGQGDKEEVVLIRHFPGMGENNYNTDQVLLNIFSPGVQNYYKRSLRYLKKLGFDAIRGDMGSYLLKKNLSGFLAAAGLDPAAFKDKDPLREILKDASMEMVFEAYDPGDQEALIEAGEPSPVAVYNDSFFRALAEFSANPFMVADRIGAIIEEVLLYKIRHPGTKKRFLLYPTNFDQNSLNAMAHYPEDLGKGFSVAGVLALSFVTAYLAKEDLGVMLILRDALGQRGDIRPIVGGDISGHRAALHGEHAKPFVNTAEELAARTDIDKLEQAIREAPAAKFKREFMTAVKGSKQNFIRLLDNADLSRIVTLGWRTEKGEWVVFAVNLRPRQGPIDLSFIEFPVPSEEKPRVGSWEAKDAVTGEPLALVTELADGRGFPRIQDVSFTDTDYRLIVLTPKAETQRSEAREQKKRNFPVKGLKAIANGEAKGFEYFGAREARDYMNAAALHLSGLELPNRIELAEDFMTGFQARTTQLKRMVDARRERAVFYYGRADFKGFEGMKPAEFLEAKGISLEQVRGKNIHVVDKYSGMSHHVTISINATNLERELKPTKRLNVTAVSDLDLIWMEKTSDDSEEQDEALDTTNRSEMRQAEGLQGFAESTNEPNWTKTHTPRTAKQHIYSRQWECGLPMDLLEKIEKLYGAYVAGEISQVTLTGGLGALMPDLFEAWTAIGLNVTGIHPLWNFIKNTPLKGADAAGLRKFLGEIAKQQMEDTGINFDVSLNVPGSTKPRVVSFRVYKTQSMVHKAPQYYLDAYTTTADGKEEPAFLEVYDDTGKREIDMAFFAAASERLIQILEKDPNPGNVVLIDHEVFVSLPTRYLKKAKRVTLNHTVFRPGLFEAWEGYYEMLNFPERLRSTITHDGKISIADFTAEVFHLITGVNLVEHLPALLKNIFRTAWHRVIGFYDQAKQIRSTNGIFLPRWQSREERTLIERAKEKLSIQKPEHGLPAEANDRQFFEELDKNPDLQEQFKIQQEWVGASDGAKLLIWLRERRGFKGASDWLGNTFKEYQKQHQMSDAELVRHLEEMEALISKTVLNDAPENWLKLEEKFAQARDLILGDPIVCNVRRQVPYKGPDKYEEILAGVIQQAAKEAGLSNEIEGVRPFNGRFKAWKDGKLDREAFKVLKEKLKGQPAVEELRKELCRVLIGGRTFDLDESHDRFLYIRFLTEVLGVEDRVATLEDYTYYEAQIIARGVQGAVMLSDEDLEASSTFMMKVKANRGEVVGPYAGSNPEVWDIRVVKTIGDVKTIGEKIEVLNEKGEPNTKVITQDILREKNRTGEWEIRDGIFVAYADEELSRQEGGKRRPSARSLLEALKKMKKLRSDPATRRERMYAAISNSWKVDMVTGQAMAHAYLIENMLREEEEKEAMFDSLRFESSDYAVPMNAHDFGWKTRHPFERYSAKDFGLFGLFRSFRDMKTWQDKGPSTRGIQALESLRHHAQFGDIFKYLREGVLVHLSPGLQPFKDKIESLAAKAETASDKEVIALNLEAMDLTEMLLVRMAGDWFERYMRADSFDEAEPLRKELVQGVGADSQPWADYIVRYLEGHPDARALRTRENKIRSFVFAPAGQRPVMVSLNMGAIAHREKDASFEGLKARTQVIIDKQAFLTLTENATDVKFVHLREPKRKNDYAVLEKKDSVAEAEMEIGVGIPMPLGIEVIEWRPMKLSELTSILAAVAAGEREPLAIDSLTQLIRETGADNELPLTAILIAVGKQESSAMASFRQLIREARTDYEPPEGRTPADHLTEQLAVLAGLDRKNAATLFGENLKPLMMLIGLLRPDLLKTSQIASWDREFFKKVERAVADIQTTFGESHAAAKQHNYYVIDSSHHGALVLARKDAKGDSFFVTLQFAANDRDAASDGKITTQVSSEGLARMIDQGAFYRVIDMLTGEDYGIRGDLLHGWIIRTPFVGGADRVQMLHLEKITPASRSEMRLAPLAHSLEQGITAITALQARIASKAVLKESGKRNLNHQPNYFAGVYSYGDIFWGGLFAWGSVAAFSNNGSKANLMSETPAVSLPSENIMISRALNIPRNRGASLGSPKTAFSVVRSETRDHPELKPTLTALMERSAEFRAATQAFKDASPVGISNDVYWKEPKFAVGFERMKARDWNATPHREVIQKFLSLVGRKDKPVLDVGMGSGRALKQFKENGFTNLWGIDISPELVRLAVQGTAFGESFAGRFRVADLRTIPFPGKIFGGIFISDVLLYLSPEDQVDALLKLRDMLEDGSPIFVRWAPGENRFTVKEQNFSRDRKNQGWVFTVTPSYLTALLEATGFRLVEPVRRIEGPIYVGTEYEKQQPFLTVFARKAVPSNLVVARSETRESLKEVLTRKGVPGKTLKVTQGNLSFEVAPDYGAHLLSFNVGGEEQLHQSYKNGAGILNIDRTGSWLMAPWVQGAFFPEDRTTVVGGRVIDWNEAPVKWKQVPGGWIANHGIARQPVKWSVSETDSGLRFGLRFEHVRGMDPYYHGLHLARTLEIQSFQEFDSLTIGFEAENTSDHDILFAAGEHLILDAPNRGSTFAIIPASRYLEKDTLGMPLPQGLSVTTPALNFLNGKFLESGLDIALTGLMPYLQEIVSALVTIPGERMVAVRQSAMYQHFGLWTPADMPRAIGFEPLSSGLDIYRRSLTQGWEPLLIERHGGTRSGLITVGVYKGSPASLAARQVNKRSEIRATAETVMPATMNEFIKGNESLGGGKLQGFRGVIEKIMDGILSLTVYTKHAVNIVTTFFSPTAQSQETFDIASVPATPNEQKRFADARKVLLGSKVLGASDALILAPEFGVDLGAALLMRKIAGDAPVAVLIRNEADRGFLDKINVQLHAANRPLIFATTDLHEATRFLGRAVRGTMNIKPMVYSDEKNAQADLLLQQYGNAVITVTPRMYKNFLSLTGVSEIITRLRDEYLATARSA